MNQILGQVLLRLSVGNSVLQNKQEQSRLASGHPQQDKASFSVPWLSTGLLSARAWVIGSCAAEVTGVTFGRTLKRS